MEKNSRKRENHHRKDYYMTLEEIKASDKTVLTPADVAPVLRCDPQWIRLAARERPDLLGFPVIILRSRTKIPRIPFLESLGVKA